MKRNLLFSTILVIASFISVNAQQLKNDVNFLKSTTLIYSTLNVFDEVYRADNRDETKKNNFTQIATNTEKIKEYFKKLKVDFANDTDFKEYELLVQTITKSTEMLKNDDDTWMLGFTLIKMNINDFVNSKY